MEKIDTVLQRQLDSFASAYRNDPRRKAELIQFPLWSEAARGVPNSTLRGALFAAIQGKERIALKRELLAVQQGVEIRFTGWQLDQSDLDVWEQALHLARLHPLGTQCHFTAYGFLKALGRRAGGKDHEWLKDVFARLHAASVEITKGGEETYFGHLIDEGAREESTGRYILKINPRLSALYAEGWTATDWLERQNLRGKPLALWLHGYLATHAKPFPMSVETYHRMSGSRTKEKWKFKQNLKAALEQLKIIGALISYHFDGDLLHVERVPSSSQLRHLNNQTKA